MKLDFFRSQIERLCDVYGSKTYPPVRVTQFWDKYGEIDGEEFKQAIDRLISSSRFAPLGNELDQELIAPLSRVREKRIEELRTKYPCVTCKTTGRISLKLKEGECDYSFRCHCRLGAMLFPNFPMAPRTVKLVRKETREMEKPKQVGNMKPVGDALELDF